MPAAAPPKKKAAKKKATTHPAPAPKVFAPSDPPFPLTVEHVANGFSGLCAFNTDLPAFAPDDEGSMLDKEYAWLAQRTPEELAALYTWAEALQFVVDHADSQIQRRYLVPPACMAGVADLDLVDVTTMLDEGFLSHDRILEDEPAPEPPADAPVVTPGEDARDNGAPVPVVEKSGQLSAIQEPPAKPITALRLETPEQRRAVEKALDRRIVKLGELAKKIREEGKENEAKSIEREIQMIRESLSSQLRAQSALAFNEGETLVQAVGRMFQGEFRSRTRAALLKHITAKKGESYDDARARKLGKLDDLEGLIGNIGEVGGALVVEWLTLVADRAYQKGLVAHGATPSAIARESLQAFEMERQGRDE